MKTEKLTTIQIDQYTDHYAELLLNQGNPMAKYLDEKGLLYRYLWNVIEQQNGHHTVLNLFSSNDVSLDVGEGGFSWHFSFEGGEFWCKELSK